MSENKRHRLAGISENHKKESIEKIEDTGKEKGITLETPRTEEQKVSVKKEGDGTEAPKKKKNIIRVYHAQNASDGGKNRKKAPGTFEKTSQALFAVVPTKPSSSVILRPPAEGTPSVEQSASIRDSQNDRRAKHGVCGYRYIR